MHISEGVLSAPVLIAGACAAAAGVAVGLKRVDYDRLINVAVLASAFFVASLAHAPVGPASAHLVLNGLLGFMLGWAAFPAILVGLLLQAMLFQYGGFTTLGVNTVNMALPAVLCHYAFRPLIKGPKGRYLGGFLCGAGALLLAGIMTAAALALSDEGFLTAAKLVLAAHLPLMAVEGLITAGAVVFLARVRPELLETTAHEARPT